MTRRELDRLYWRSEQKRLSKPLQSSILAYKQNLVKYLTCSNEFYTATAVWKRVEGIWFCSHADPPLKWMIGLDQLTAKIELIKHGCSWEWSESKSQSNRVTPNNGTLNASLPCSSKVFGPLENGFVLHPQALNDGPQQSSSTSLNHPATQGVLRSPKPCDLVCHAPNGAVS